MLIRCLCLCASFLAFSQPGAAEEARAQRGLLFVQTNCASCHAVRLTDASPLAAAPPLRDLHKRYPVADLEESFSEGIVTGHPTMPQFQLDAPQIGDLIAYLQTLER
ncbi:MAG: cytochrome c class [Enterovirga sp.]|jgi:cytochrome c|nr:cytochrome c class [Enterovirga sp.]